MSGKSILGHYIFLNDDLKFDMLELLFKHGADIKKTSSSYSHKLIHNYLRDNPDPKKEVVEFFLSKENNLNELNEEGKSALHYYFVGHRTPKREIVELLFENGSDPNISDSNYRTPFHHYFEYTKVPTLDIIELFYKYKADLDNIDFAGRTALTIFFLYNPSPKFQIVEYFLQQLVKDKSISRTKNYYFKCYLSKPNSNITEEIINLFLGLKCDLNISDNYSGTPLHYYIQHNLNHKLSIIKLFIENGMKINLRSANGLTSLNVLTKRIMEFLNVEN